MFEIDAQLLSKFSALGTTDKDELIQQLRCITGESIPTHACQFVLELSEWNLQRAVGAYFDYQIEDSMKSSHGNPLVQSNISTYNARFHPQMNVDSPGFLRLLVENSGSVTWPIGTFLSSQEYDSSLIDVCPNAVKNVWSPLDCTDRHSITSLEPSHKHELCIALMPPTNTTPTVTQFLGAIKICLPSGEKFGDTLFCTATLDQTANCWRYKVVNPNGQNDEAMDEE